MKLKTGIIGCGKVGDFHAKAYAQLENSEFTAVCDANLERQKPSQSDTMSTPTRTLRR